MNGPRLAALAILLLLGGGSVRYFRTVANPIFVVCAPWTAMLAGQQLITPFFPFSATAALMVAVAVLAFALGTLMVSCTSRRAPRPRVVHIQARSGAVSLWTVVSWLFVALALANLASVLYYGFVLGIGRVEGGGLISYVILGAIQESALGWVQRAIDLTAYAATMLFALETARRRRLTLPGALFLTLVITRAWLISSRFGAFLTVTNFAMTWVMVFAWKYARPSLRFMTMTVTFLVVGAGFYWVTMARRHAGGLSNVGLALDMATTFLGPPAAFSAYLDVTQEWRYGTFSGTTIEGPLELLGFARRGWGQHEGLAPVPDIAVVTTVYTGLQMLLEEVGVAGTASVMVILGWITNALFASYYGRPSIRKGVFLANLYFLLLWMPVVLMSYYVFWWAQFAIVSLLGTAVFQASMAPPTATPAWAAAPAR